ncbi:MAG: methyltransferase, partial [Syntrophales bacterium]
MSLSRAFMESRVLLTGAELDLFTLTASAPLNAREIAGRIGADLRSLTILLDALAAMGLLIKKDDAYRAEQSAARLLAAESPESILPIIRHSVDLWERWGRLTGKVVATRTPDTSMRAFIGGMHAIARPLAPRIVALVDPAGARRLLDVGGGSGTYTLAFLQAAPEMRATIFDLPQVIDMARERVGAAGMLERITLVPGDFRKDPLPGGHDLAFVSAIIHQN